ncbi:small integral membrane protein 6 [Acomys russatus]|uniref:small integral membrane protein 6 n=1 Tax=Acomys russatus TaxID=60746 RepID=UPI0021E2977D|nr:small integral membrane protein 6 [Acomys russatus]
MCPAVQCNCTEVQGDGREHCRGQDLQSSLHSGPLSPLFQIFMSQMVIPKTFHKDDFWNNPWDVGGLIVIGLFISTVLFFIIFAIVFTVVEKTVCEEE